MNITLENEDVELVREGIKKLAMENAILNHVLQRLASDDIVGPTTINRLKQEAEFILSS